jgi:hypothetical protein
MIWSRSIAAYNAIFDAIQKAARARGVEIFSREYRGAARPWPPAVVQMCALDITRQIRSGVAGPSIFTSPNGDIAS